MHRIHLGYGLPEPIQQPVWRVDREERDAVVTLGGDWVAHEAGLHAVTDLPSLICELGDPARLRIVASQLGRWDSALVAFIWSLQRSVSANTRALQLDVSGLPEALRRLLALANADDGEPPGDGSAAPRGIFGSAGAWATSIWIEIVDFLALLGTALLGIPRALLRQADTRARDVIAQMHDSGLGALAIIAVVNGLVGAILAFVGALQLRRFGAGSFVSDLVGVAVIREMAPIMTAIVMAGRTGGAYAAQIAMMQANEEIDALLVSGISPYDYLVLPRLVALITMMPVLYVYGCLVGIVGGLFVAMLTISISPTALLVEFQTAVSPIHFFIGLTKSICFGAFIALSSCQIGLRSGRSAGDVGHAATSAVVTGIVGIIALDAIFAACANVLGI